MVAGGEIVMINVAVLVIVLCIALAVVARLDFRERGSAGCGGSELPVCGGDGFGMQHRT